MKLMDKMKNINDYIVDKILKFYSFITFKLFRNKLFKFIASALRVGTPESAMRMFSFMVVASSCASLLSITLATAYLLLTSVSIIDFQGIALLVSALIPFLTAGLMAKHYSKKTENDQTNEDEQNEETEDSTNITQQPGVTNREGIKRDAN